jgi:hypothetical protein
MQNEVGGSISLSGRISKCNSCLFKKIISYTFSGFSIIFIGYLVINIVNNYPPIISGISP